MLVVEIDAGIQSVKIVVCDSICKEIVSSSSSSLDLIEGKDEDGLEHVVCWDNL